jgi:hypothetical protein
LWLVEIRRFCCSNVWRQRDGCVLFSILEGFLPYITIISISNLKTVRFETRRFETWRFETTRFETGVLWVYPIIAPSLTTFFLQYFPRNQPKKKVLKILSSF